MSFVKCSYCKERFRAPQLKAHEHRCIVKRRRDKIAGLKTQRDIYAKDQAKIDALNLAEKQAELKAKEESLAKEREALEPTTKKGTKK